VVEVGGRALKEGQEMARAGGGSRRGERLYEGRKGEHVQSRYKDRLIRTTACPTMSPSRNRVRLMTRRRREGIACSSLERAESGCSSRVVRPVILDGLLQTLEPNESENEEAVPPPPSLPSFHSSRCFGFVRKSLNKIHS
jgi:hypothetical protein